MAIQQNTFKRGGFTYTHYKGTDGTGQAIEYINRLEPDEQTGYPVRFYPDITIIKRKPGIGNIKSIFTRWQRTVLDASGEIIEDIKKEHSMFTSQPDIISFVAGLGDAIMMSDANGFSYKILGFPDMPVYSTKKDATYGRLLTYTEEQENGEPVFTGVGSYGYITPGNDSDTTNP